MRERTAQPEKRNFISFLRHPFRKPEPKPDPRPVADLRRPVCLRGPCEICPTGQLHAGGCGAGTVMQQRTHHDCSGSAVWSGSPCVLQTQYLNDCTGLRTMLERQTQRMQAAESIRQSACVSGASSECSGASASWQSEENLYRSLEQRYQQCRVQNHFASSRGNYPRTTTGPLLFDSLHFDASN